MDDKGKLVGIVSERDLLHASSSDATSLSVWELSYLIGKIQVDGIMSRKVITVAKDVPIEQAAMIMVETSSRWEPSWASRPSG